MTGAATLLAGFSYSDRVAPMIDGAVSGSCLGVDFRFDSARQVFRRALAGDEFDLAEMSLATHCILASRGDRRFVGLPVFTSRMFRHHSIYVWGERIRTPRDLAGKRIGLPDYQMTSAVWLRGILAEHHGLDLGDITWCIGNVDRAGPPEPSLPDMPRPGRRIEAVAGASLIELLEKGELDAVISPGLPQAYRHGATGLRPLFADPRQAERAYFEKTGIFPIMHLCVLRREAYERDPTIASRLYALFDEARLVAMNRLDVTDSLVVMAPWLLYAADEASGRLSGAGWTYGIDENRHCLQTFFHYLDEQGLLARAITFQDIFVADFLRGQGI